MQTMPVEPSPILMKFSSTSRGSPGETTICRAARNWKSTKLGLTFSSVSMDHRKCGGGGGHFRSTLKIQLQQLNGYCIFITLYLKCLKNNVGETGVR